MKFIHQDKPPVPFYAIDNNLVIALWAAHRATK